MIYFDLFYVFFRTGLFTIGGGLAALPLLQEYALKYNWLSLDQFYTMVAVSQSTPGPIGINMATYVGYNMAGVLGSIVATVSMALPSIIIITIIASFFFAFNKKPLVKNAFYGIRPAVTGLIATAAYTVISITLFSWDAFQGSKIIIDLFNIKAIILFVICFIIYRKFDKIHPVVYIAGGAIYGMLLL